jgi:hypothetical protein
LGTHCIELVTTARNDVRDLDHHASPSPPAHPASTHQIVELRDQGLTWSEVANKSAVVDHLGRAPTRAELTAARRAAHGLSALGRARVLHVPGADGNDNAGDRIIWYWRNQT